MAAHGGGSADEPLVDADRFMRVSEGLKQALADLGRAQLTDSQRARWQRRLLAITNAAKEDLAAAERRLEAYQADFSRQVPAPDEPSSG